MLTSEFFYHRLQNIVHLLEQFIFCLFWSSIFCTFSKYFWTKSTISEKIKITKIGFFFSLVSAHCASFISRNYFWKERKIIFRLIWNQTMSVFCSKSIGNGKYNLILVWFNKISKIFLCMYKQLRKLNPLMAIGNYSCQFNICCPRDCVSRTANVEGTARH